MDLKITGRVAVVTGGDSGIGLETAKLLAAEGCRIVLSDQDQAKVDEAVPEVQQQADHGAEVIGIAADLADRDAVTAFATQVKERFGLAHILAHFAGARGVVGDFLTLSDDDWMETIQIDLMGAVRVCRAFLPQMIEAGWGRILLTASENAVQPYPEETPYNSCKAGVITLAKGLSKAYSDRRGDRLVLEEQATGHQGRTPWQAGRGGSSGGTHAVGASQLRQRLQLASRRRLGHDRLRLIPWVLSQAPHLSSLKASTIG